SQVAASVLREAGFADVSDLLGGAAGWETAGMPVEIETEAGAGSADGAGRGPEVRPAAARALLDEGGILLDVREAEEWDAGHVEGAVPIPMRQVHARVGELPADRRIVVVCRSGGRSAVVTQSLRARGLDAVNLTGGM